MSKKLSVSPSKRRPEPRAPPEFLVDRSLGRHQLPDTLRALGYVVHTLSDVYGEKRAQNVKDWEWVKLAGKENWVVLTKDDRIRYRRVERDAFVAAKLRVFCMTTAKLRGEQQAERFVNNINRIVQRARKSGPYIYGVHEKRLEQIWPHRKGSGSR